VLFDLRKYINILVNCGKYVREEKRRVWTIQDHTQMIQNANKTLSSYNNEGGFVLKEQKRNSNSYAIFKVLCSCGSIIPLIPIICPL